MIEGRGRNVSFGEVGDMRRIAVVFRDDGRLLIGVLLLYVTSFCFAKQAPSPSPNYKTK